MANKTAIFKWSLQYTDGDGKTQRVPDQGTNNVSVPYQAISEGTIDVPDAEVSATAHAIPFGSINVAATLVVLENKTGQELILKVNGSAALQHLGAGQSLAVFADPTAPGTNPITALSLTTTATQSGAGSIVYRVFGDPT